MYCYDIVDLFLEVEIVNSYVNCRSGFLADFAIGIMWEFVIARK